MKVDIYIRTHFKQKAGRGSGRSDVKLVCALPSGKIHQREFSSFEGTTENAMEIIALTGGLKRLLKPCDVVIHTENDLLRNAIMKGWLEGWARRGFRKARGGELQNEREWRQVYMCTGIHRITAEDLPEKMKTHTWQQPAENAAV